MQRKAKREGKDDDFYLRQGAENPSIEVRPWAIVSKRLT